MTKQELTEQVRKLMIELKTLKALELLFEYVKDEDERQLETSILMQQGTFNRLQQERAIISHDNYERGIARVNYAIEQILDKVPEKATVSNAFSPSTGNGKIKILFLTANPKGTSNLRLGEEIRKVKDGFKSSSLRDKFEFVSEPAVKVKDITAALMQQKPDIVHFSGHGAGVKGLAVEGDEGKAVLFPTIGLKNLFSLFKDKVKCVVLNACYASEQAIAISREGSNSKNEIKGIYAVGMNDAIGDKAAIDFAVGFYQALGEGYDYEFAFSMGMIHISVNLTDATKPELWFNGDKIK